MTNPDSKTRREISLAILYGIPGCCCDILKVNKPGVGLRPTKPYSIWSLREDVSVKERPQVTILLNAIWSAGKFQGVFNDGAGLANESIGVGPDVHRPRPAQSGNSSSDLSSGGRTEDAWELLAIPAPFTYASERV